MLLGNTQVLTVCQYFIFVVCLLVCLPYSLFAFPSVRFFVCPPIVLFLSIRMKKAVLILVNKQTLHHTFSFYETLLDTIWKQFSCLSEGTIFYKVLCIPQLTN